MAQHSTNYSNYTTGQEPSDWSQDGWAESGIWTVQEDAQASKGTQLLQFQETVDNDYPRILRWDIPTDVDGEVEVLALLRADVPSLGVFLRQQQYMEAYYGLLDVDGGSLIIGRRGQWDWNHTSLGSQTFTFTQGDWYYVRFRATGSDLKLKAWASGDPEPSGWDLQVSDTGITSAGSMGVFARNIKDTTQTTYFFDYAGVGTEADSAPMPAEEPTPVGVALTNAPQTLASKVQIETTAEQPNTDFGDYTTGEEPSDWSQDGWSESGIWTIQQDSQANQGTQLLRYQETIDNNYPRILRWDTPDDVDGEVEVLALLRADGPSLGVFLRQQQYMNAYYGVLDVSGGNLIIGVRRNNWDWNHEELDSRAFTFTQDGWYFVRFRASGTGLNLKIWTLGDQEPSNWTLQVTDTGDADHDPITSDGGMGLFTRNTQNTNQITYFYDYVAVGLEGASAPKPASEPETPLEISAALTNSSQTFSANIQTPVIEPDLWISAYLPGYGHVGPGDTQGGLRTIPTEDILWNNFTHLFYFALTVDENGNFTNHSKEGEPKNTIHEERVVEAVQAAHANGVPVIMSIGGAGNVLLNDAIENDTSRANLIDNLMEKIIKEYGIDGIDIDLEPIDYCKANCGTQNEEWVIVSDGEYEDFVKTLRQRLDSLSSADFSNEEPLDLNNMLITAAIMGGVDQDEAKMFGRLQNEINQFNIMTYDASGPYPGWVTWHNNAAQNGGYLFPSTDEEVPSAERDADDFHNNSADANNNVPSIPYASIGIGTHFGGYEWWNGEVWTEQDGWTGESIWKPRQQWYEGSNGSAVKEENGEDVSTPTSNRARGEQRYHELGQRYGLSEDTPENHSNYQWDDIARVSYLSYRNEDVPDNAPGDATDQEQQNVQADGYIFVSFEDTNSVQEKIRFIREKGLGGVIIWELSAGYRMDQPSGEEQKLLEALGDEVENPS